MDENNSKRKIKFDKDIEEVFNQIIGEQKDLLNEMKINPDKLKNRIATMISKEKGFYKGDNESLDTACKRYIQTTVLATLTNRYVSSVQNRMDNTDEIKTVPESEKGESYAEEKREFKEDYMKALYSGNFPELRHILLNRADAIDMLTTGGIIDRRQAEAFQKGLDKYTKPKMDKLNEALGVDDKFIHNGEYAIKDNEEQNKFDNNEVLKNEESLKHSINKESYANSYDNTNASTSPNKLEVDSELNTLTQEAITTGGIGKVAEGITRQEKEKEQSTEKDKHEGEER